MQRFIAVLGCVLLVTCLFGVADQPEELQPRVFAVRDARVVVEPGKVLAKATVVIRDGLIEAVGTGIEPPVDAVIIDGTGLTVYPGFIDGLSYWGYDANLRRPSDGPKADTSSSALIATKPDHRRGLTPEFTVQSALRADSTKEEQWRRSGFTSRLLAPEDGLMMGQSAFISLSGRAPREVVRRAPVALHMHFRRLPGNGYPVALMGSIAHCRQTMLDAGHYQRLWSAFEKGGGVGKPPPADPTLQALAPVLAGKIPVVFTADTHDEIDRALNFAQEFGLRPILFGGRDAWKAADRLKKENVPVILRIDFVEQANARLRRSPDIKLPGKVVDDEERKLQQEIRNAAELHRRGIVFGFSLDGFDDSDGMKKFRANLRKVIDAGLPANAAVAGLTIQAARILGVDKQIGTITPGKAADLVITDGDFADPDTQICTVFADGNRFDYAKPRKKPAKKPVKTPATKTEPTKQARHDDELTEIDEDRTPKIRTNGNVLIQNATILTVTKGTLTNGDVLVQKGKIVRVGRGLKAPKNTTIINAKGMFVMPGIIDTHVHFAIDGGVNEFSLSVVPEVRVRDVIRSDDVTIYRALAGGVTTARLLHGSSNVIGGQDAVIKLKYGQPAAELIIADAPRGVKFALGENVKRTSGRFPNTRLGVEALLIRAFTEARAYQKSWEEYGKAKAAGRNLPEPRRDLRLEALVAILEGDLKVHCHCYRADEILMLLRIANHFGFRVQSLQHALEGYKVAPEIAKHGASCSSFSDWWAYKIEAYDAIPFNPALLQEAGALVCLKSDSFELVRHMYQEAAKCVKYGRMSETEALRTITINGARQLGLENRIGSIEVGKDADLAIFNGHPLNSYSRVEMTLVEGEVYFQRSEKRLPANYARSGPTPPKNSILEMSRNAKGKYAIVNATVHPAVGPALPQAAIIIENGRIRSIVKNFNVKDVAFSKDTTLIQADGLHVYPGMIDAGSVLGLTEVGSARETQDYAELGDFQPDLRASTAINPDSELIPVTRANGVTTVVTRPAGSIIAGQSALINLAGWVPREMALVDPLALHIEFPPILPFLSSDANLPRLGGTIARKQRELKIRRLKEIFQLALLHDEARRRDLNTRPNPRLEALIPYARCQRPVIIQANRKREILDALQLASDLKIKPIIAGAIDAWKVTEELKKHRATVIFGPVMSLPQEPYDPYDGPYSAPAKLHAAGIPFCIRSSGASNTRNLPYEAAMAVSYGLPPEEGLKAVTIYPARILGVAEKLGSIEEGKIANLVITNGDLLQATTQVLGVWIAGKPFPPESKHTRLYERYRRRLEEVRNGLAPLGIE
ncbi:MAG: hypothetical protein KatS3mg105_2721 [Gemmatales bacterium]|nr:MAG: hypothetical protein KatS3mg105_2721 [Gemmatales bacterium]